MVNKQTQYHINHVKEIYDIFNGMMRQGEGINPNDIAILTLATVQSETAEQVNGIQRTVDATRR